MASFYTGTLYEVQELGCGQNYNWQALLQLNFSYNQSALRPNNNYCSSDRK